MTGRRLMKAQGLVDSDTPESEELENAILEMPSSEEDRGPQGDPPGPDYVWVRGTTKVRAGIGEILGFKSKGHWRRKKGMNQHPWNR